MMLEIIVDENSKDQVSIQLQKTKTKQKKLHSWTKDC